MKNCSCFYVGALHRSFTSDGTLRQRVAGKGREVRRSTVSAGRVVAVIALGYWLSTSGVAHARSRTPGAAAGTIEEQIRVPLLGQVAVYRPDPLEKTRGVLLFVSGDGGWNLGVVDMARRTAGRTLVVGISMPAWQKIAEKSAGTCWYPAGDLEQIAQAVEKTYKFPRYIKPILVGYSSGATVVYGALAQGPAGTFAGAVSLGFCPDLEVARPFCGRGDWKPSYEATEKTTWLPARRDLAARSGGGPVWTALQGLVDQVCDPPTTEKFVAGIPAARVVILPKVGHGFSVPRNWAAAYDDAIDALLDPACAWQPSPSGSADIGLPPARATAAAPDSGAPAGALARAAGRAGSQIVASLSALGLPLEVDWPEGARTVLIFVSGDGGWAELDREVSRELALQGVAVIGWNTLRYFWQEKTPAVFGADLARVIEAIPDPIRIFAGGYSFGAEVVPVTLAKLVPDRAQAKESPLGRVAGMVLLSPGRYASFEVSPLDWIRTSTAPTPESVREAISANMPLPVLCIEPSQETDTGCPEQTLRALTRVRLEGGHHFSGDYVGLARTIAEFLAGGTRPAGAPEPSGSPGRAGASHEK